MLRDHCYLVGLIGLHLCDTDFLVAACGLCVEAVWLFGVEVASCFFESGFQLFSIAFCEGGVYVLCDVFNYVFIDCGFLGFVGRGGHGYNDLLSFEATLGNVSLVIEGGCFVYMVDDVLCDIDCGTCFYNMLMVDG